MRMILTMERGSRHTRIDEEAGRAMNYQVLGHQVEVHGLCPLCAPAPVRRAPGKTAKHSKGR